MIYSPELKRSRIATEAQFLVMNYVFETLQYRRYEWKCDSLNQPSINAAKRLGFVFEGIFRNAVVYKGRNRDTAWFSMLPNEW
ncbi:TPA: GNAT family N-acetyltransferase [Mannheimia haemolytica]